MKKQKKRRQKANEKAKSEHKANKKKNIDKHAKQKRKHANKKKRNKCEKDKTCGKNVKNCGFSFWICFVFVFAVSLVFFLFGFACFLLLLFVFALFDGFLIFKIHRVSLGPANTRLLVYTVLDYACIYMLNRLDIWLFDASTELAVCSFIKIHRIGTEHVPRTKSHIT